MNFKNLWFPVLLIGVTGCGSEGFDTSSTPSRPGSDDVEVPDVAPVGSVEKTFDLASCGYDVSKPTAIMLSQRLAIDPFKKTIETPILGGILKTKTEVTFSASMVTEASLSSHVSTYSGAAAPAIEQPAVQAILAELKGSSTATPVDLATRAAIGETYPQWAGLFCTLQPVKQIVNQAGRRVAITFSQPIPFGVLANATIDRMKLELASARKFTNVEAKVTESDDPALAVGTVISGSVTATSVPATQVSGANGDFAILVSYEFGGDDKSKLLGLPKSILSVVNTTSRKLGGVQIKPAAGEAITFK